MAAARAHLDSLTKPPGSLGRLEELVVWLAGVTGTPAPILDTRTVIVAAADHGVAAHGVSAWPQEVTRQMVANFVDGGAAISVLAGAARATVTVVDVGVATGLEVSTSMDDRAGSGARLVQSRVRDGTHDFTAGPAMSSDEARYAVDAGRALVTGLPAGGRSIVAVGDMGIGNTTAASAVVAAMTGLPVPAVTGYGAGVDEAGRARKIAVIERGLAVNRPDPSDPMAVLAAVGGLEIAALVGVILTAAERSIPVVLDGFITGAAALVATGLDRRLPPRMLASHRSTEPGHAVVLERLGSRALLDLDLRLGEGSGAALALLLIDAALRVRDGMATFQSAGITRRS